ncbi:ABC transporter [Lysinibacillus contaminans]|uniref:ABC transporter n=1 Tax=Lysinibacillus contaminans TaxID=1293441 RepID=A0ABR5K1U6_9BACI|nr:ABC transporter permease [Lysinibacillus contaminans]KOS68701.1 ABC transporter [Lysinibacillus contaminans]
MLKLIQNEWMKLWHKNGTWMMLIFLVLFIIVPGGMMKYQETKNAENTTWQEVVQQQMNFYKDILASEELSEADIKSFEEKIAIFEYRLANNVPIQLETTVEDFMSFASNWIMLVTLFTVILAASIVSSEFSTGTIKMLLTRPISRAKVLTSKLITVFLFGVLLLIVNIGVSALTGFVLFDATTNAELEMVDGKIVEKAVWGDLAYSYLLACGDFVMSTLFAFFIGSVFRSSSLAIGLTMFLSFMGQMIVSLLSKYEIVKYIWITHSNLKQYETGNLLVEGITMPFSLTVLAIYAVIFTVISYMSFMKRDVTA